MSAVEKIKTYLDGRKSGVSPQELADRFLINISTVRRALKQMEKNGHAKKIPHKTPKPQNPKTPTVHKLILLKI